MFRNRPVLSALTCILAVIDVLWIFVPQPHGDGSYNDYYMLVWGSLLFINPIWLWTVVCLTAKSAKAMPDKGGFARSVLLAFAIFATLPHVLILLICLAMAFGLITL